MTLQSFCKVFVWEILFYYWTVVVWRKRKQSNNNDNCKDNENNEKHDKKEDNHQRNDNNNDENRRKGSNSMTKSDEIGDEAQTFSRKWQIAQPTERINTEQRTQHMQLWRPCGVDRKRKAESGKRQTEDTKRKTSFQELKLAIFISALAINLLLHLQRTDKRRLSPRLSPSPYPTNRN